MSLPDIKPKSLYLLAAAIVFVSLLTAYKYIPKTDKEYAYLADEGYYFYYARDIAAEGIGRFRGLVKEHIADKEASVYPAPTRFGYIWFSSLWLKLFGFKIRSLAQLSFFCQILFLIIAFLFLRKYFTGEEAVLITTLLSASPLGLAMSKRALSESASNLFNIITIWLFLNFMRDKKNYRYIYFAFSLVLAVFIKEIAIFLIPSFIVFMLLDKYAYRRPLKTGYLLGTLFVIPVCVFIIYSFVLHGWKDLLSVINVINYSSKHNIYALRFEFGPWYKYFIDYMLISPLTLFLSLGFIFTAILKGKDNDRTVIYFLCLFLTQVLIYGFLANKGLRFVFIMDFVIRVFSVLMLKEIFLRPGFNLGVRLAFAVFLIAAFDLFNFWELFCAGGGIYDPITFALLIFRGLVPKL